MDQKNNVFPLEIRFVDRKIAEELVKYYEGKFLPQGEETGFVQVSPKKYFFPSKYLEIASDIYNMPVRPLDAFVCSYPRSGTTWTQEMVWMIVNDLDYAGSDATPLTSRYPFLEFTMAVHPNMYKRFYEENKDSEEKIKLLDFITQPGTEQLLNVPSPRFIKTHLPPSLLPPTLLETAKMVYVARDPRDVVVSLYHLNKSMRTESYVGDFKNFWNNFRNDLHCWTPYFEHVKEAWNLRHHRNMLFLFYEELSRDLPVVKRVADFYDKKFTSEQVQRLCQHLSIDSFKRNVSVNYDVMRELNIMQPTEQGFIRKGKTGGWREYFDEEMTREAEEWIAENLRDTDLCYPHMALTN